MIPYNQDSFFRIFEEFDVILERMFHIRVTYDLETQVNRDFGCSLIYLNVF